MQRTQTRALRLADSDSERCRPMMLSHITSCIETVCLRKFGGHLASILLIISYFLSLQYQCLFLRPGTVGTVSGSVKCQGYTSRSDIEITGSTRN